MNQETLHITITLHISCIPADGAGVGADEALLTTKDMRVRWGHSRLRKEELEKDIYVLFFASLMCVML